MPTGLTLEDLSPLRTFVVEQTITAPDITIEAHHAQVRTEGSLEIYRTTRNLTSIVALFAPGQWRRVRAEAPSDADVKVIELREAEAASYQRAQERSQKLAVEETANTRPN